ncbi:MAG: hypothetical protein AMJ79_07450 [Phycisphaerae bacterium SM23_30]|nr:MAG: hypothetical protein AMJ79_07450 [Phycisphaerae bacterium SM23_30]
MTRFRNLLIFIIVFLFYLNNVCPGQNIPQLEHLKENLKKIKTFDVSIVSNTHTITKDSDFQQVLKRKCILKAPDLLRVTVWIDYGSDDEMLGQDQSRNKGFVLDYLPFLRSASVNRDDKLIIDYRFLPLLLNRVIDSCTIVSTDTSEDYLEITWNNPKDVTWDKVIITRFDLAPPYDLISVSHGHDMEHTSAEIIHFSNYQDIGYGMRFPGKTVRNIQTASRTAQETISVESIALNVDIPDSEFVINLPPGTQVIDHILHHNYIIDTPELPLDPDALENAPKTPPKIINEPNEQLKEKPDGNLSQTSAEQPTSIDPEPASNNPWYLWLVLVIIVGILFLSFFLLKRKKASTGA